MSTSTTSANRQSRYTKTAVVLHWLMAALLIAEFAHGWWMQQIPKQPPGLRAEAFNLHKSVGLILLALVLVRLGWRIAHPPPAFPPIPAWQETLARANHFVLYAMMIAMPNTIGRPTSNAASRNRSLVTVDED